MHLSPVSCYYQSLALQCQVLQPCYFLSLHSIMFSCTIYSNCNVPLHFNHEDAGTIFIWHVNMQLPEYIAGARRPQQKSSAPWKSNISHSIYVVPPNSVQNSHLRKTYTIKALYILILMFLYSTEDVIRFWLEWRSCIPQTEAILNLFMNATLIYLLSYPNICKGCVT